MAEEDATNMLKQLASDQTLQLSVKQAQAHAVVAEAQKAGFDVSVDDLKAAASGAQKGFTGVLGVPGVFDLGVVVDW